jgi:hypothetical protein
MKGLLNLLDARGPNTSLRGGRSPTKQSLVTMAQVLALGEQQIASLRSQ